VQAISEESSNSPKSILNSKFLIHPSQNIEKRRRGRKENREKEIKKKIEIIPERILGRFPTISQ